MSTPHLRLVKPNEPPPEWYEMREALGLFPAAREQRHENAALEQLAQSRRERGADALDHWEEAGPQ